MWTIFKVFIEFAAILLLLFMFWGFLLLLFLPQDMWDPVPWPGIELAPSTSEGEILTTGPPGKSLDTLLTIPKGEGPGRSIKYADASTYLSIAHLM